jgi:hypothetical protein
MFWVLDRLETVVVLKFNLKSAHIFPDKMAI